MPAALWEAVDRLVDGIEPPGNLFGHRLQLLAGRQRRSAGRPVDDAIALDELRAIDRIRASRRLLQILRDAYDGPILILKGLEIAASYPSPELRVVHDLDVLVDDAEAAYAAALAAGLQPVGQDDRYYSGLHHVRPLWHPEDRSVLLEIHRRPNWVPWALAPSGRSLLADAVASRVGVPETLAPAPSQHAVIAAAHSWGDVPFRRLSDLVDIQALLADGERDAADATAATWGLQRMWQSTVRVADAILLGHPAPWWLSAFAPDMREARERTVLEQHVRTWIGPLLALPPRGAAVELGHALRSELAPQDGETWSDRRHRIWQSIRHLDRPNGQHQGIVGQRSDGIE